MSHVIGTPGAPCPGPRRFPSGVRVVIPPAVPYPLGHPVRTVNGVLPDEHGDIRVADATATERGLMSAEDKAKLDGVEAGAEVNAVATVKVDGAALVPDEGRAVDIDLTGKADKATTLAGYGITDAKIVSGVITLGSNSITPLTEHQSLAAYVNGGSYDSNAKKILLKHDSTTVAEIDATAFIKDGMVSTVAISGGNLVITFNTDAGKAPVSIPLTDIFNPANYYDKTAANTLLSGKADKVSGGIEGNLAALDATGNLVDSGLPKGEVESLLFPQYYPDGSVKSAAEFTAGIKYDAPDTANRTITVKPFCNTDIAANDNSSLVGRVVIPPFVDASGNGYISDDGTRFKVVGVSGGVSVDYSRNLTAVVAPATVATIGDGAFEHCAALSSVSFPAVTNIEDNAFGDCNSLVFVSLPAATSIGNNAFFGCSSLPSVSLPAVTNIGNNAFATCDSLASVSFPVVTSIGNYAFSHCTLLTTVDFGDASRSSVPSLGIDAFSGVPTSCKIVVPDAQYDAWTAPTIPDPEHEGETTANPWYALVTAGCEFLRHSEWEYARWYELAALRTAVAGKADKSTTYTKTEVDAIVQALKTGSRQVVGTLPASGQPMVIYMVPKSASQTNNAYDEYIWTAAGAWEKIGDTEIDLSGYYTKTATDELLAAKQDTISDLAAIRSGAAAGATAVQPESGKGLSTEDYTTAEKTKLSGIETGAEVNVIETVKVNGTALSPSGKAVDITVPTGSAASKDVPTSGDASTSQVVMGNDSRLSDARTPTAHKSSHATGGSDAIAPSDIGAAASSHTHSANDITSGLAAVATSGSYNDLNDKPTIPTVPTNVSAFTNDAGYVTAAALRYDLPTNATAINTASQETVEGETVNYGAATLADRTGNRVSITAALDELRVTFPPAVSGKLRDFGLRVEVGTGSAALTAPAIVPIAPTGETIKLENNAKQIPALADGTATAKGVTLLYFSESAPGVFFAKGEQVEEVA